MAGCVDRDSACIELYSVLTKKVNAEKHASKICPNCESNPVRGHGEIGISSEVTVAWDLMGSQTFQNVELNSGSFRIKCLLLTTHRGAA